MRTEHICLDLNLACKPSALSLDLTCKFSEETAVRVMVSSVNQDH